MPWIVNVKVVDIDDTTELENFVDNDTSMRNMLDAKPPTYKSENRNTVNRIAGIMNRIRLAGLAAAGVFAVIAILVVFNTIRMSIFNRKEEIYMMRLVGASRWFIIGPFVVEASFYGIISSIAAALVAFFGTFALRDSIGQALMNPTISLMQSYWLYFSASIMFIGVMIGVVSALLATRKYVKVK
jgi:cell division transport system permease protein